MFEIYLAAAFWFLASVLSTIIANRVKISMALMESQYSFVAGVVIASAVIPTLIANKFFLPAHLLSEPVINDQAAEVPATRKHNRV